MGNTTSELQQATDDVQQEIEQDAAAAAQPELYQFVRAGASGRWEQISSRACPGFYDANEDARSKESDFWLEVEAGDIDTRADDALSYVADPAARRVTFAANEGLWALKFPSAESYRAFMTELEDDVFQNTYGFGRDSAKAEKELGDFKNLFFNADASAAAAPMEVSATPDRPARGELKEKATPAKAGTPIEGMIIGANTNTYLRRGATFDVMRNVEAGVEDSGIAFSFTPLKRGGPPGTPGTPSFTPGKVLLANGETRMNMLSPAHDNTRLFHADVEYQKIVSEWTFQKDTVDIPQVRALLCTSGTGGQHQHLLGLDSNRLCKWDLRDPRGVVQEAGDASPIVQWTGGKDFARGTNFSCMATSGAGHVVVGSRDGKIRLYSSKTLTQAKTSIPGLGKPITAVDVTYDGAWVLATTDDYLMVVKASFSDEDGKGRSAFTDKGAGKLALPRLLRLKPEDRLANGSKPLKNGRFTWVTEAGSQERWIVASCGRHTVIWNFGRVKSAVSSSTSFGGLPTVMDYVLNAKDEDVVDSNFMHDRYAPSSGGARGDALVVATPHKVYTLAGED
ncbi:VID27 cytoplasmic protein-domain-containing protein [Scenedesmus sp. NREL 46B-D3]|nr:VID27 cytoplasmic protein-domain-containing protein [Scenedesmus sp. NREL 46B-D3]